MATFWVGQAGAHTRTVAITPEQWAAFTTPKTYLAFEFAKGQRKGLVTTQRAAVGNFSKFTFNIPKEFFTNELRGPCKTQVVVLDGDLDPAVVFPVETGSQVTAMLMTPAELTA